MGVPADHLPYLQRKDYAPTQPRDFSGEETVLLRNYGRWMEALAAGWIKPATPDQAHFVQVARGEAEPRTPFEQVWRKLHSGTPDDHADAAPLVDASWPKLDQLAEVRRYADEILARKEAERAAVLRTVQAELDAIEQKYAQPIEEANQAVAELETEVKAEVLEQGHSRRAGPVQAIYYRGAVTWDSKALVEYARGNPAIEQFRKQGAPRVVIRYR
jgi:hypothetical protein